MVVAVSDVGGLISARATSLARGLEKVEGLSVWRGRVGSSGSSLAGGRSKPPTSVVLLDFRLAVERRLVGWVARAREVGCGGYPSDGVAAARMLAADADVLAGASFASSLVSELGVMSARVDQLLGEPVVSRSLAPLADQWEEHVPAWAEYASVPNVVTMLRRRGISTTVRSVYRWVARGEISSQEIAVGVCGVLPREVAKRAQKHV